MDNLQQRLPCDCSRIVKKTRLRIFLHAPDSAYDRKNDKKGRAGRLDLLTANTISVCGEPMGGKLCEICKFRSGS